MTDNTVIQELLTCVIKWKTFDLYYGTLLANMLDEIIGVFFLIMVQLAVSID